MKNFILIFASLMLVSCGKSKSGSLNLNGGETGLSAPDAAFTTTQNGSVTIDLGSASSSNISITRQPAHGRIRLVGQTVTYRATDPLFSGTDTFGYRFTNGTISSNEATVSVTLTPLASGTSTHTENYFAQNFSLAGWRSYSSTAGHSANSLVEFRSGSYNNTPTSTRRFRVYGDSSSYAGNAAYLAQFGSLPVDGSSFPMGDWPWKADLIHIPECGVDTTITVKVQPNNNEYPMFAVLLNYDIDRNTSNTAHELTGYQVLVNSGGGSMTLSRFVQANELATAYIDRWPNTNYGTEAMANPVTSGPYKGWNYRNGPWPAGGNIGIGGPKVVAVRYQYDVTTKNTTISYEARPASGADATPGVWDVVVNLTGADSLTPGGSFGIMPLNYHTQSLLLTTDFDVAEYKLSCVLP